MFKYVSYIVTPLSAALSDASTTVLVPASIVEFFDNSVDFGSGDHTYATIYEGTTVEQVKVTGTGSNYLVIERAQGPGETAQTFSSAANLNTTLNQAAILEIAAGVPYEPNIVGEGAAEVSGTDPIIITVPEVALTPLQGITIVGSYPEYQIGLTLAGSCCTGEGDEEGGGVSSVSFTGILQGEIAGNTLYGHVDEPQFTGDGVDISGTWPNIHFVVSAPATGVEVTAGAGLSLTGNPSGEMTLFVTNTGVTAGTYGDIVFNARGQVTFVEPTFNPISELIAGAGIDLSRTGGSVTVAADTAAVGVAGIVPLADADDPLDPDDETTAVTPKLLAGVIADLESGEVQGVQSYSGEADAAYTDTVPTSPLVLTLAAGEFAAITVTVTVQDGAAPSVAQEYGLAVFSGAGGARLQSNRITPQNNQFMTFVLEGPFNDGLVIKTTALTGTMAVISHGMTAVRL